MVGWWGLLSHTATLINCSAEIESIHGSKRQNRQTIAEMELTSVEMQPFPSLHTNDCYQYFQSSFLQMLTASFCQKSMASHWELWQWSKVRGSLSSDQLSFHPVSSLGLQDCVCSCVYKHVCGTVCRWCWSCFAAASILNCLQLEWWLDSVTHEKI